jgi:hypothetical protein
VRSATGNTLSVRLPSSSPPPPRATRTHARAYHGRGTQTCRPLHFVLQWSWGHACTREVQPSRGGFEGLRRCPPTPARTRQYQGAVAALKASLTSAGRMSHLHTTQLLVGGQVRGPTKRPRVVGEYMRRHSIVCRVNCQLMTFVVRDVQTNHVVPWSRSVHVGQWVPPSPLFSRRGVWATPSLVQ